MTNQPNPFEISRPTKHHLRPPGFDDSMFGIHTRKRNRHWEKEHQSHKAVYRGVDPKLALRVKSIAGDLLVPVGDVARVLIEFSLHAYEQGDLDLRSHIDPCRLRRTLFPSATSSLPQERPPGRSRRKKSASSWRVVTTWRGVPPELKKRIIALASEDGLNVPMGELITALLGYGIRAYDNDLLLLEPAPQAVGFSLR